MTSTMPCIHKILRECGLKETHTTRTPEGSVWDPVLASSSYSDAPPHISTPKSLRQSHRLGSAAQHHALTTPEAQAPCRV